jgi:hypothetical protein
VGGLLSGLRVQNTKKGDLMARASLEDLGGSIDIVFFPKTYAKFSAWLQAETPVLIKGNVSGEPDRPELHADEIVRLATPGPAHSRLSVVVSESAPTPSAWPACAACSIWSRTGARLSAAPASNEGRLRPAAHKGARHQAGARARPIFGSGRAMPRGVSRDAVARGG